MASFSITKREVMQKLSDWIAGDMEYWAMICELKTLMVKEEFHEMVKALNLYEKMLMEVRGHTTLHQHVWLLSWITILPTNEAINLLDYFFDTWQEAMYQYLRWSGDYEEIVEWYKAWKKLFKRDIVEHERVVYRLEMLLDMMNKAAEGVKVERPMPMVREAPRVEESLSSSVLRTYNESCQKLSFLEVIEHFALKNDIPFCLSKKRTEDGQNMYELGVTRIKVDRKKELVYARIGTEWKLVTLEQLSALNKTRP